MTGTPSENRSSRRLSIAGIMALVAVIAAGVIAVGLWFLPRRPSTSPPPAAPTLEERVTKGEASPLEIVQLGQQYLVQDQPLKAAEMAFRARKLAPNLPDSYQLLGVLYLAGQKPDKAQAAFREAVRVAPKALEPRLSLARFELEQGRPNEALTQLNTALKIDKSSPELWVLAGRVQRALHGDTNAEASFERALKLDPQFAEAYSELGTLHLDHDHYTEAVAPLDKAYSLGYRTPLVLSCLALALVAGPADDASAARADQLLTEAGRPEMSASWFAQGLLLQRKRDFPAAQAAFVKVLQANPRNERAQYALAMAYRDGGDLSAAQKAMARHDQLVRERQRKKHASSSPAPAPPPR